MRVANSACLLFSFLLVLSISISLTTAELTTSYTNTLTHKKGIVELDINNPDLMVDRLSFILLEDEETFTLRIFRGETEFNWVSEYFVVNTTGMQGKAESVMITIKLPEHLIYENGEEKKTVSLDIFEDQWIVLQAVEVARDGGFLYYTFDTPRLDASYAVTVESIPTTTIAENPCDRDWVCEPLIGEKTDNCGDCAAVIEDKKCIPSERYCSGDYLFLCSDDGYEYEFEECEYGCTEGTCRIDFGLPTGMVVALDPIFISVVVALVIAVVYLGLSVLRMRHELYNAEKRKVNHDHFRTLAKRKMKEK